MSSSPALYRVSLRPGAGFAELNAAIERASALPEGLSQPALQALFQIVEGFRDFVSDGDLRTASAGEFEVSLSPQLSRADRQFIAAIGAGDLAVVRSHLLNLADGDGETKAEALHCAEVALKSARP